MERKVQLIYSLSMAIIVLFSHEIYAQFDFGDAPDPNYPTLLANNGAHHVAGPFFLGGSVDFEGDGMPVSNATGDDYNGQIDDEDGISFSTWLVPGQNATIIVNASNIGFLDAWIDFQGNGNWTDPGDQIFTGQMVTAGSNTLVFNVPTSAVAGIYTHGRFRYSSIGGLPFSGVAPDGEVEDYFIIIGVPSVGDVVVDPDAGLSYAQNEISMTVVPTSGRLVAAYNDNPYPLGPGIGVSYSIDNGQTWSSQQLTVPMNPFAGVPFLDTFDPTINSDDSGQIFVAHIATDFNWGTGPESGLFVHKSTDGGQSWSAPYPVDTEAGATTNPDPNYRFNDRCQIIVDRNLSSPYYNNIYLVWIKDRGWNSPQPWSDIYVSVSSDGGTSFTTANQINNVNNDLGNMPIPAIASNGDLYVLWMNYNVITGGNGTMFFNKSTDGGINWGTDTAINTIPLPPLFLNGGTDVQAKGAAIIRTSPVNSNDLYVVYSSDPDGGGPDEADIFFIKSTNGGSSWSTAIKLNDDSTTNDQVLPWMEVTANGIIDVVWYDRRNDTNDLLWDVYATTSIDGGATFAANMMVNTMSFSTPQPKNGFWFGEYLALAATNTDAYIAFTSSVIDTQGDVFFTSFNNPVLGTETVELIKPKVYPNPTKDIFYIDLGDNIQATQIQVFDQLGKLLLYKRSENRLIEINLEAFASGLYFVKLFNSNGTRTLKVLKN